MKTEHKIKKYLFDLVLQIRVKLKHVTEPAENEVQITPTQVIILRFLVEEGECGQSHLVEVMKRDKAQITRLVQDLVLKTLVIKTRDPKDGRRHLIKAAPKVHHRMADIGMHEDLLVGHLLEGFSSEEILTLQTLLVKMINNIQS